MAEQTDKGELLSQFQAKVDEFARFQEFIAKAEAQASRFAPEVVEKVITSNREKAMAVVEDLIPLTADVEDTIQGLTDERDGIKNATAESEMAMQELELRQAIGEIDDEGFEKESASLKGELEESRSKIEGLEGEIGSFTEALGRWTELGTAAGVLAEPEPEPEPEEEEDDSDDSDSDASDDDESEDEESEDEDDDSPVALEEEPLIEIDPADDDVLDAGAPTIQVGMVDDDDDDDDDLVLGGDVDDIVEIVVDDDDDDIAIEEVEVGADGVHAQQVSVQDDVSVVFEESDDQDTKQEEILLSDDVLPEDDGDLDILGADEPLELDAADGGGEIKPRRAVLLYAEGTPEEQVHPVTKDVVSIGRGRDNDIQVRNDSKVSRYHCKIYRRGPNYYIEDNKSANGSLVNGELITERRLFGGEEIIIGETFFRFRILD